MDKENDQIAHRRIVAGREIVGKYGRNNNSPATGCWKAKAPYTQRSPCVFDISCNAGAKRFQIALTISTENSVCVQLCRTLEINDERRTVWRSGLEGWVLCTTFQLGRVVNASFSSMSVNSLDASIGTGKGTSARVESRESAGINRRNSLSIAKMLCGWKAFEISDIQDIQLSRRNPAIRCNNVALV
jgi:hypothetical protein